jgi:hypothetical protein
MISSTRADLQEYRDEMSKIIRRLADEKAKSIHLVEISMEKEGQTGEREWSVDISKRWVEESDWIIVIVGFHYGSVSDQPEAEGLSMTEWEYRHAIAKGGKKVFAFMADDPVGPLVLSRLLRAVTDLGAADKTNTEKVLQFRQALQARHLQIFDSLVAFRTSRRPSAVTSTNSSSLPAGAGRSYRCRRRCNWAFTDEVELTNCKAIHDGLHELLQKVIRPLHDGVLRSGRGRPCPRYIANSSSS